MEGNSGGMVKEGGLRGRNREELEREKEKGGGVEVVAHKIKSYS